MKITNSPMNPYGGWELDRSCIGNKTSQKDRIRLPYNGSLPREMSGEKASIDIVLTVRLDITMFLNVKDKKYRIDPSTNELESLLSDFFWDKAGQTEKGNGVWSTRWDSGLSDYWLGYYQSSFVSWTRLVASGNCYCDFIRQLSDENRRNLLHAISEYKNLRKSPII